MIHINSVDKNPPIKTYLHYSLPLSIICANEEYKENIYNMFIQLVYAPEDICPFDFHEYNYQAFNYLKVVKYKCFDYGYEKFTREIISQLNNHKYFIFWIDCFEIPNENNYMKSHGYHGFMIYGYDDDKQVFFGLGHRQSDSRFGELIIPFKKLYESMISETSEFYQEISFDDTYWPSFDIPMAEEKYRYYLKSLNYDLDDYKFHPKRQIVKYGLNASIEFKNIVNDCINNGKYISATDIGIFTEHKLFMCERTKKMVETLDNKRNLLLNLKYIENLKSETLSLKLLLLKYNIRLNKDILNQINERIDKIHQLEISILSIVTNVKD